MKVAVVNHLATSRIVNCKFGMSFIIDSFDNEIAHVRDYRFGDDDRKYCIWSLSKEMYEVIED